jgi:hypothetical protein
LPTPGDRGGDVADRLDVTKGWPYYCSASKDELVTAVIETLGEEWADRLEGLPAGQSGTPPRRLRRPQHPT